MDVTTRRQYLQSLVERYLKGSRVEKGHLLDEYCRNTRQNRKYAIRKIQRLAFGPEPPRRRRRTPKYGRDVQAALHRVWVMFDQPCGQRLRAVLTDQLDSLRGWGELEVSGAVAAKLREISAATIDRLLRPRKSAWKVRRQYGRAGGNLIAKRIPLRMTDWDVFLVGYVEMDLVFHCGATTAGEHIFTLSAVEISSGWWEGEAFLGRAQPRVFEALKRIRTRSPFRWKGIDSDNDPMFINDMLRRYARRCRIEMTRSRAYHKNDNAYIEQKNFTHVRRPLGYLRYDTAEELALIQGLYRNELRLYKNFFQPVMKLIRKDRVDGRIKRVYDRPKTPYRRLLESGQLTRAQIRDLEKTCQQLNPADLKRRIDAKLEQLYSLYQHKQKRPVLVDPYKRIKPSTVTFLMRQQAQTGLPG